MRWPAALLLAALYACGGGGQGPAAPRFARPGDTVVGRVLPVDGGEIALEGLRGKPVVLHFFVTWQLETVTDLDELRRVRAAAGDAVTLVSVGLDPGDGRLLTELRASEKIDWILARPAPELFGPEAALGDRLPVTPTTVVLDAAGAVVWVHHGSLRPGELAEQVARLAPRR